MGARRARMVTDVRRASRPRADSALQGLARPLLAAAAALRDFLRGFTGLAEASRTLGARSREEAGRDGTPPARDARRALEAQAARRPRCC